MSEMPHVICGSCLASVGKVLLYIDVRDEALYMPPIGIRLDQESNLAIHYHLSPKCRGKDVKFTFESSQN